MNFNQEFLVRQHQADEVLLQNIPIACEFDKTLLEAMAYSLEAGGKRLRPILIQSFARLFGADEKWAHSFMAAMEFLHTYSLVHDDLPALDNDDFRRGVETTHRKYGEAAAILAGDGLLHESYEIALQTFQQEIPIERVIKALTVFSRKTGIRGMLGGQSADVLNTGMDISEELLQYIYQYKTGALMEGSMMIGAILGGASEDQVLIIEKIGASIGLAFQVKDDLLDLYGDATVLGKPVLSDEKNKKMTYVTIYGAEKAQEEISRLTQEAVDSLAQMGTNAEEREFLTELFYYLTSRDK